MALEAFCVVWMSQNVIEEYESRLRGKNKELSSLLLNMDKLNK